MKETHPVRSGSILFWLAVIALLIAIMVIVRRPQSPVRGHEKSEGNPAGTNVLSAVALSNAPTTSMPGAPMTTNSSEVVLHPLAVAKETATHEWTKEDGRDPNVIRRLAHNNLEYQRLVEENQRIKRRQLVYRKDTAAAVMQRARLSGERVKQLTIPGLDGQELQFEIDHADLEPSWQVGAFTGRLINRPKSMVTLAFRFGRESFMILSPEDGTYLQAYPREPGELIITSFDPDTYQPLPGGEPIRTSQR